MAHLHYASADDIHMPSMAICYSYSESHLRKRRPVHMVPPLLRSYPTRWRPLFIVTYSGTPSANRLSCLYWGLSCPKKRAELCVPSKLLAKLAGEISCRAIDILA